MLNKEVVFTKESQDTLFALIDGNVLTIKYADAEQVAKEANNFFSGKISVSNLTDTTRKLLRYLHISEIDGNTFEKISDCLVLDRYSPREIINSNLKNTYRTMVVNLHGFILILPNTMCLHCAVKRMMYKEYKIYKYEEFWSMRPLSIYREKWDYSLKDIIQNNIGTDKVVVIKKKNGDIEKLNLISFPDCKFCKEKYEYRTDKIVLATKDKQKSINGSRSSSILDTYKKMCHLLNSLGPITGLEFDNHIDKLCLPVYQSEIGINPLKPGFKFHGGKGYHRYQAMFSAIGEALERYNAQQFGNESILEGSYNQLLEAKERCLDPKKLILDRNYPIKYSDNLQLEWVGARKLIDLSHVWIPANSVFFVYSPKNKCKEFIPQDTTGLASGMEIEDAILQGIQEIIERDAYAIYFRGNFIPYSIDINTIKDPTIRKIIRILDEHNIEVNLQYLKTNINSYVIHCITYDRDRKFPVYTHGAGASLNPCIAIIRAITECVQLRVSQIKIYNNKSLFIDDKEYAPYISWGEGKKFALSKLLEGTESISLNNMPNLERKSVLDDINCLVESLHDIGYEVYVSNLSRSDNGIKTVRVVIPGLQPADDTLRMNLKRYEQVAAILKQPFKKNQIFEGEIFS